MTSLNREAAALCNNSVMVEVLKMLKNPDSFTCNKVIPCQYSRYLLRSTETDLPHFIQGDFTHHHMCCQSGACWGYIYTFDTNLILILDENLLSYDSKVTFGWLNMVGEIGGTVGLCLGKDYFISYGFITCPKNYKTPFIRCFKFLS